MRAWCLCREEASRHGRQAALDKDRGHVACPTNMERLHVVPVDANLVLSFYIIVVCDSVEVGRRVENSYLCIFPKLSRVSGFASYH